MDIKPKREGSSPPSVKKETTPMPFTTTSRPPGPQLISHLPQAEEAAMKTFVQLSENIYQYKTLGRSRQTEEGLVCDCSYEPGVDPKHMACGDGSDCINRLTQVECLEDECRCRSHCQNQRFQQKQFAQFEIVQTEMKGFGLRASIDIPKDTFIYEYIGEVISNPSFTKRMREYAEEGIRHFYFMMLQKDEFIDATKKGGLGRFANHSCNPNCYVARWTVGKKVRMGIFSKRSILKDEELTFNYNVDRYGHDPQPCYCREEKCVGFIGGKTQTDIGAMDDLVLDALGVSEEVESLDLKGSKKRRGKKMDEDFVPVLNPLALKDVPKVVTVLRDTSNKKVMMKLLSRIKLTEDPPVLRQVMRLRGFGLMASLLQDNQRDLDLCMLVLECLPSWPLINRNKIEDSKIEEPVKFLLDSENERLKDLADQLIKQWSILETGYRIPKKIPRMDENGVEEQSLPSPQPESVDDHRPTKRPRFGEHDNDAPTLNIKPLGQTHRPISSSKPTLPVAPTTPSSEVRSNKPTKEELAAIIAAAAAAEASPTKPSSSSLNGKGDPVKHSSKDFAKKHRASKEQRLKKLIGAVVVRAMSKYQSKLDHDAFKDHAKNVTQLIAEKEKKSSSYATAKLDKLSDEKQEKIKKFVKSYVARILHKTKATRPKQEDKYHAGQPNGLENGWHQGGDTPNSNDGIESTTAVQVEDDDLQDFGMAKCRQDSPEENDGDYAEEDSWDPDQPQATTNPEDTG